MESSLVIGIIWAVSGLRFGALWLTIRFILKPTIITEMYGLAISAQQMALAVSIGPIGPPPPPLEFMLTPEFWFLLTFIAGPLLIFLGGLLVMRTTKRTMNIRGTRKYS